MIKNSICKISKSSAIALLVIFVIPTLSYARGRFNSGDFIGTFLIWFIVVAVVFLLLREVFCWYAKINERLAILKEIRDSLNKLSASKGNATETLVSASNINKDKK